MDQQYNSLQKQKEMTKSQVAHQETSVEHNKCHNCGASIEPGQKFCEECGAPIASSNACHNCGAQLKPGMVLCPECHHPVNEQCSFCGAQMTANDRFCNECGNPRSGITCPKCNTLNFRSFCHSCNSPLNALATQALERMRRSPRVKIAMAAKAEMDRIEDEIVRLEQLIEAKQQEQSAPRLDISIKTSQKTQDLMAQFAKLTGADPIEQPIPQQTEVKKKAQKLTVDSSNNYGGDADWGDGDGALQGMTVRLEKLKEQYAAKSAEFKKALQAMVPDAGNPPAMRRDEICAMQALFVEQTTTTTIQREPIAWTCNACNVRHRRPSECAFEEQGGSWEYFNVVRSKTVINKSSTSVKL